MFRSHAGGPPEERAHYLQDAPSAVVKLWGGSGDITGGEGRGWGVGRGGRGGGRVVRGSGRKARRQTFRQSERLKRTLTFTQRPTSRSGGEVGGQEGGVRGRGGEEGRGCQGSGPNPAPPPAVFLSRPSCARCLCPPSSPLRSPPPSPRPPLHPPATPYSPAEPELSNLGGVRPASTHLADRRLGRCTASARHNQ